jgi:hypothetical protein
MRGWTFIDDDSENPPNEEDSLAEMKREIKEEMLNKLASEWNTAHNEIEQESFRDRDDRDNEADYLAEIASERGDTVSYELEQQGKTKEECKIAVEEFYAGIDKKKNEKHVRLKVIEELLYTLGARMMRPYEHWNEDERYMEYMENRYNEDIY